MITIKSLCEKLKKEKKVAIFSHVRPDGDTVGSTLALKLALEKLDIVADVYCEEGIPPKYSFIKGVLDYKNQLSGEYSAFIALDCADPQRLGVFAVDFLSKNNTYNVDHHVSNVGYAKFNYVKCSSSNCENIFDIIKELSVPLDEDIATALATGVVSDTGNFKHKNVQSETFSVASELKSAGADFNLIINKAFQEQSKQRAKLFGTVMNKIRYFLGDRLAVASVLDSDLKNSGARPDETEGFIDFVMGIDVVEVGVCILETGKNKFKCSFRSKGVNVNEIALTFGGGGHVLASGCQIQGEYEEVVDKIRYAVHQHLPE